MACVKSHPVVHTGHKETVHCDAQSIIPRFYGVPYMAHLRLDGVLLCTFCGADVHKDEWPDTVLAGFPVREGHSSAVNCTQPQRLEPY